jgi:hypothetical protein
MVVFAFSLPKGTSIVPGRSRRDDDAGETAPSDRSPSRNAFSGPSIRCRPVEDNFTLKTVGHFGQRFGGEGEDAKRREEREKAGCYGGAFHGRREGGQSNRYDNGRTGQRLGETAMFDMGRLIG